MKKICILLLTTILVSPSVYASFVYTDGKVESVKMFGTVFVIYVDNIDTACTGTHRRVAIDVDDPLFNAVISTVLTAKATNANIQIGYQNVCTHNVLSWGFESLILK